MAGCSSCVPINVSCSIVIITFGQNILKKFCNNWFHKLFTNILSLLHSIYQLIVFFYVAKYLGTLKTPDGRSIKEVHCRIAQTKAGFHKLEKIGCTIPASIVERSLVPGSYIEPFGTAAL